jgi:hypothetical protein
MLQLIHDHICVFARVLDIAQYHFMIERRAVNQHIPYADHSLFNRLADSHILNVAQRNALRTIGAMKNIAAAPREYRRLLFASATPAATASESAAASR